MVSTFLCLWRFLVMHRNGGRKRSSSSSYCACMAVCSSSSSFFFSMCRDYPDGSDFQQEKMNAKRQEMDGEKLECEGIASNYPPDE